MCCVEVRRTLEGSHPGYCANGFGLMHMLGNATEWTADNYIGSYLNSPLDGHTIIVNDTKYYTYRGGAWIYNGVYVTSSERDFISEEWGGGWSSGFRLVRFPIHQ